MPNWKKIIISGSDASLNSLISPSITGSLLGTASYVVSSSYANSSLTSVTASYALTTKATQPSELIIGGYASEVDLYISTKPIFLGYLKIDFYASETTSNSGTFMGTTYSTYNFGIPTSSSLVVNPGLQIGGGAPLIFDSGFNSIFPKVIVSNPNSGSYRIVFTPTEM